MKRRCGRTKGDFYLYCLAAPILLLFHHFNLMQQNGFLVADWQFEVSRLINVINEVAPNKSQR